MRNKVPIPFLAKYLKQHLCLIGIITASGCADHAQDVPVKCDDDTNESTEFIKIPAGSFLKGAGPKSPEEHPSLMVHVDGFWLLAHEVTNDQFARFIEETGYITDAERSFKNGGPEAGSAVFTMPDAPNSLAGKWKLVPGATWQSPDGPGSTIDGMGAYPVVHVSHADATAYAVWAGGRLPGEIEWEYAASLGLEDPNISTSNAYDEKGNPTANTWQGLFPINDQAIDGFSGPSPAGCYGKDKIGLSDMIGNVWEWTDTPYDSTSHTIKGGSYLCSESFCARYRPAARQRQETSFSSNHIGFRIIRITDSDLLGFDELSQPPGHF